MTDIGRASDQLADSVRSPEIREVFRALEPQVKVLIQNHRETSIRWMPHEIVPWGDGEDYVSKPWRPEQSPFRPEIVTALETNLLTEDNLPYYHSIIAGCSEHGSAMAEWNALWTAEEATHSAAIRDYMLLKRVMDPAVLERNRLTVMQTGFHRPFASPYEVFAYTTAQELGTRISHLETGRKAGEPVLMKILSLVSRDENFHYIFYRSLVKALIEIVPDKILPAIATQFYSFGMPGGALADFAARSAVFESERIFGGLEFRDGVVKPILAHWKLEQLRGLTPVAEKARDRIMKLESVLTRAIERTARKREH